MATRRKTTRKQTPKQRVSSFHQRMTIAFLVLSSLLVILIFYFTIAEVHIEIVPESSDLTADFSVELLPNVETTLAGTNIIPSTITTGVEERTQTIQLTEGTPVPSIATGEVTIINNYNQSQPLVATTRLLTPENKLFRIEDYVVVPAGGSVTVNAYADEPGTEYEIAPTRFTIPGLWEGLQDQIYAESSDYFTGGERLENTITQEVINTHAEEFLSSISDQIEQTTTPTDGIITMTRITGEPTWEASVEPGTQAETFQITLQIPVTTITFARDDLESVAINNLVAQTPKQQQFLSADLSSLSFELATIDEDAPSATLAVSVQGKSASRLQKNDLSIEELQGKQYEELRNHLQKLPGVADVKITFTPSWLKKVPSLQDHVFIEIVDTGK